MAACVADGGGGRGMVLGGGRCGCANTAAVTRERTGNVHQKSTQFEMSHIQTT